jgi:hypothetical protein
LLSDDPAINIKIDYQRLIPIQPISRTREKFNYKEHKVHKKSEFLTTSAANIQKFYKIGPYYSTCLEGAANFV